MSEYVLELKGITKIFPGVKALNNVQFQLKPGEVHALMGENGAGKSTFIKVITGVHKAEEGEMFLNGQKVDFKGPKDAQAAGIAAVYQHPTSYPHLTVAENIFMGHEIIKNRMIQWKAMNTEANKLLKQLDADFDATAEMGTLSVAQQQMVEIAKALSINARVLIMDEPTSALTAKEIDELFRIIRRLKDSGCGIVYISHRLEELQHIVDRVTIMRDGQYITSTNFVDTTMADIITNMVGREIKEQFPRVECQKGEKIFEVKHLNAGRIVRDISFSLYAGEIVGFAGLMGAGRTETTRAIFGADPRESGEIFLDGKKITIHTPSDAIKAGIVLAPEDRKKDGLCTKLPIRENIALPNLDLLCNPLGVINRKKEDEMCDKVVQELRIKTPNVEIDAAGLSGGNQQKVVVGKWLARDSRVVIFDEPTRGIDVAAKVEIYNLMNQLKQQGIAVMFVSSEMPEVMGIADRIVVMCDGRITGEVMARETTQEEILTLATRFENKFAAQAAEEEEA